MGTRDDGPQLNAAQASWRSQWKLIALLLTLLLLLGYNIGSSSLNTSSGRELTQRGQSVLVDEIPSEIQSQSIEEPAVEEEMHPLEKEAHELVKQLEETIKEHEVLIANAQKEEAASSSTPQQPTKPSGPAPPVSSPTPVKPAPVAGKPTTPSTYTPPPRPPPRATTRPVPAGAPTVKQFAEEFKPSELEPGYHSERKYNATKVSKYELEIIKSKIAATSETVSSPRHSLIIDQAPGDMKRAQAARRDNQGRLVTTYHHTLPDPKVEMLEHSIVKIGGLKQRSILTEIAWSFADLGKERGLVLLFHGCGHSAKTWWNLPIDRKLIRHLLDNGFSVLAFSSQDPARRCWDDRWPLDSGKGQNTNVDINSVLGALKKWILREEKMDVPLFALGASSGGTFATLLSRAVYLRGTIVMISPGNDNALRTSPSQDPLDLRVKHTKLIPPEISPDYLSNLEGLFNLPPLFFSYMEKDTWASAEAIAAQAPFVTSQNPWLMADPTKPTNTMGFLALPVRAKPLEAGTLNVIDGIAEHEDCSNVFFSFANTPTVEHFDLHRAELKREKENRQALEAKDNQKNNWANRPAEAQPSPLLLDKDGLLVLDPRNSRPVKIVSATIQQAYKETAQQLKTNHPVQFTPVGEAPDERDPKYKKQIMKMCSDLFVKYDKEINEVLNSLYAGHEMTADHAQEYIDWMSSIVRRETDPKFLEELRR